MPNLTGYPALDVAIGLAFMFFLLSTISSAINEAIAAFLGWRAKTLEDAAASLVGDPNVKRTWHEWLGMTHKQPECGPPPDVLVEDPLAGFTQSVFQHWTVKGLVRDPQSPWRRRSRPSYIAPDVFSLAVSETLASRLHKWLTTLTAEGEQVPTVSAQARTAAQKPWRASDEDLYAAIVAMLAEIEQLPGAERPFFRSAVATGEGDLASFRSEVEAAFNDTMARATGWYKRKTQLLILGLAIVLTISLNVDTVKVATRLWNDQALRNGVAAAAIKAVNEAPGGPTGTAGATGAAGAAAGSGAVAGAGTSGAAGGAPALVPVGRNGPGVVALGPTGPAGVTTAGGAAGPTGSTGTTGSTGSAGTTGAQGAACRPSPGDPSVPTDVQGCITFQADRAGKALTKVEALNLPIGWGDGNKPDFGGSITWLAGWLLTIVALSLGAPFWFDLLNKLVRLRGSGVPETPDTSGSVGQSPPASGSQRVAPGPPRRAPARQAFPAIAAGPPGDDEDSQAGNPDGD
jgi:hypothetical protein